MKMSKFRDKTFIARFTHNSSLVMHFNLTKDHGHTKKLSTILRTKHNIVFLKETILEIFQTNQSG